MTEEKERLEKELTFLEESLESDIITREEYEKRKETIERKLADLTPETQKISEPAQKPKRKPRKTKKKEEELEKTEEIIKKETEVDLIDEKGKKTKLEVYEEPREQKEEIKIQEIKEEKLKVIEEKKDQEKVEEKKEEEPLKEEAEEEKKQKEEVHEIKEEEIEELEEKPDKKKKRKWILFSVLILIAILVFYFYAFKEVNKEKENIFELKPACISDNDCEMQNKIGICLSPNTTKAKCEFKEDVNVSLAIINDKNCISCSTDRMFQVIQKLFPMVRKTEIDYSSEEGRKLIAQLSIETLPSYIFESDIEGAFNFDKFKRALLKKESKYLINSAASGSSYYFKREEIKNKLDLFVLPSASKNVENNVQEILELFKGKIDYSKHIISNEEEEKKLNNELGITTYPSFLVNNQIKFSGVQSSESIKNKFCGLNKLPECSTKLSENLK